MKPYKATLMAVYSLVALFFLGHAFSDLWKSSRNLEAEKKIFSSYIHKEQPAFVPSNP